MRCLSSFTLNELIEVHCATKDESLFHSLTTSFVQKNLVQSSCTCLHLNLIRLFLVREEPSIRNNLFASTFVNPLSILKHSISFPLRRRFSRKNKFNFASLSLYDLFRRGGNIFVSLRWTDSNYVMSLI